MIIFNTTKNPFCPFRKGTIAGFPIGVQLDHLVTADSSGALRAAPAIFVSHWATSVAGIRSVRKHSGSIVSAGHGSMRGNIVCRSFPDFPRCDTSLVTRLVNHYFLSSCEFIFSLLLQRRISVEGIYCARRI